MNEPRAQRPPTTTDAGIPVASQEHSLTVGPDGPILLQDFYLIEQMANFNRERIPERQPHAKGGGAFGSFVVSDDVSRFTRAAVFQPGAETEVVLRFSTVAGERGSPDTWRDPRGFAVRFYTSDGNLDIVGNNTPVFFIRDPIKFQNFIRSQKRLASSNLRDPDMQWDFWTLSPESSHQVTWLMGDRGIPRSWRHMNGYSSHTYMWVNAEGERFWVKYHFKCDQGVEFLTQAEADRIAGEDADYHQRDLYEAIERRDFPSWTLRMQVMPFDDAKTYRFNPFDLTKVWPHDDYPLVEVGRLTLDRNVADYHTEMEQAAFQPNNTVPGTGLSPDKMLLARGFSYADAHRARLGVNYQQIPVNRPKAQVRSYSKDGAMRVDNVTDPVYYPNSFDDAPAADATTYAEHAVWASDGEMVRAAYTLHSEDDDFGQANTLVTKVMDDAARERLVDTVSGTLSALRRDEVMKRAFDYWRNIDEGVGASIEGATLIKRDT
jgi:catalase